MSKVDILLEKLCPNGVPFSTLGEVAKIQTGQAFDKTNLGGDFPVWNGGVTSNQYVYEPNTLGDTITIPARGSVGIVGYQVEEFWCGPLCYRIRFLDENNSNRFLYFFLKSIESTIQSLQQSGSIPALNKKELESVRIPLPPIEVQREIVAILDKFTQLGAELEAELKARERQYDFYRDQLLGFGNEGLKWAPFGDVATIVRGASPRPIQNFITDAVDGVPWVKIGDTVPGEKYLVSTSQKITTEGAKNSRYISPGDFILSNSMSFGRPYISKIRGCIHDGWLSISDFEKFLNADYLYHVLQSHAMQMEFSQRASNGTVSNLNADIVKSVRVPLPSLVEQARIAGVLNNFEIMLNSGVEGLPAEIKARRQQYEYYRSKLLTFKELDVA